MKMLSLIRYYSLFKAIVVGWRVLGITGLLCGVFTNQIIAQTKVWDKTIGGDNYDMLFSIKQTSDGGYIMGGYSESGISGDKTEGIMGASDFWTVKLKADGTKEWDKTFGGMEGEFLTSLQQTLDGGYILGGYSYSDKGGDKSEGNRGHSDYWAVKLNASGNKVWDKTLGGDNYDNLTSLQQTQDGGYILGGYSSSGISEDKSQANRGGLPDTHDYWVVKLNANGSKEWDKTFGGKDEDYLIALQQTTDGGYILGGGSTSGLSGDKSQASKGSEDYWVVKLDAAGSKEWDKAFGGDNLDELESLQQTSNGGYILGGASSSGISSDKSEASKGDFDYWVLNLDAKGNKIWDKTLGGDGYEILFSIQQTRDGNYILGGSSTSGVSGDKTEPNRSKCDTYFCDTDYWILKLNADGNKKWDKSFGGDNFEFLRSLQQTSDGGYILGGTSESSTNGDKTEAARGATDYWIVKLQESTPPIQTWDMRFGGKGRDNFTSAIKTADGGYLSGGYTESSVSGDKSQSTQGKNDYWIVKSDKNGKKLWDKRYGGSEDDYLNRVIQTQDGGYLLAGSSFSGKSGDKSEASQGDRDYWLVKVDVEGNKEWDKSYGGSGLDELVKVVQLSSGEYVLGGYSSSPISGDKTQPSQGGTDFWLVKISASGTKLWDKRYGGDADEGLGSFTETSDGGFFLGGSTVSGKGGDKSESGWKGSDAWAVKTDKDGNLLWEKTLGGYGQDGVSSVRQIQDDNLYLAGITNSRANGNVSQTNRGGYDYWLVKLNKQGTKLWDKRFGGSKDDVLRASTYSNEGHFILAGTSYSNTSGDKSQDNQGGGDYWVVEVDENGNKVQDQTYGGSGQDELRTVTQTKDGVFCWAEGPTPG